MAMNERADFDEAIERAGGLLFLTSREVGNSAATAALPEGATMRESLDRFKASGLRWAIGEGRLYLWSKP